jgi:hypothetical protein
VILLNGKILLMGVGSSVVITASGTNPVIILTGNPERVCGKIGIENRRHRMQKVIDTLKAVAGIIDGAIQGEDDPCGKKFIIF